MKDSKSKIRADITSKESEARIKSIFRSTPIGIGVVSNRIIIEVNERFCEMTGYKKSELIGQNSRIIYSSDKEFERVGKYKYEQIKKYGTGSIETQFRRKDGKIIDIILSSTPIDPNDLSVGITFTALDITQRKQAEQKCQESERNFRDLVEKSNIAILIDDIGGNFTYFNEIFTKLFGYSTEEIKEKSIHSLVHPDDIDRVIKFHRERIQGKKNPTRYEFKGVKKDGSIIYLEVDVVNLKDGKNIIGTRSYLWDISDRKQVEIELRKSEEKYKSIVEYSSDSIYIIDDTNIILSANQAAVKMLGSTPQKIIGKNLSDIFPRENAKTFKRNLKKIFVTGEPANYESEISFGTQTIWLDTSLNPMNDYAGKVYAIMGVSRDITERKQADETLRKSEEQLRIITDNTNDNIAITTFDLKATYIYVNPSIKQVLGYNPEDLLGESFFDYIHPDDKKVLLPIIKKYITKKIKGLLSDKNISITETIEFRFKNKLGNWRHMQSTVNLIDNQLLAITRDITEQKLAEIALRESEKNLNDLVENLLDGVAIVDENGKHLFVNQKICDITGYSEEELLNMTGWDFTRPQDIALLKQRMKDRFAAERKTIQTHYERIIVKKDRTEVPVEMFTTLTIWNGKKRPLAIIHDITERKQVELELTKHREHLEELVKERTEEIEEKNINLQRFYDATINREFRIKELRDEIEKLKSQLNR